MLVSIKDPCPSHFTGILWSFLSPHLNNLILSLACEKKEQDQPLASSHFESASQEWSNTHHDHQHQYWKRWGSWEGENSCYSRRNCGATRTSTGSLHSDLRAKICFKTIPPMSVFLMSFFDSRLESPFFFLFHCCICLNSSHFGKSEVDVQDDILTCLDRFWGCHCGAKCLGEAWPERWFHKVSYI